MPCDPNVMGYPFSSQHLSGKFFLFAIFFLVSVTNPSIFKLQPTIQEHEELVWLAGNLKLEVTNYSKDLYGLGGVAHPSGGDGGEKEDPKETPGYQPRKRLHH